MPLFLTLEISKTIMNNNIAHHCYRTLALELEEDNELHLSSLSQPYFGQVWG
jgi:hypothetical protein